MTSETNPYCDALGISVPNLEVAKDKRDANYYSLLIVALLERGEPITLGEAAQRFEEAGVAPWEESLASLKRCKAMKADDVLGFVRKRSQWSMLSADSGCLVLSLV